MQVKELRASNVQVKGKKPYKITGGRRNEASNAKVECNFEERYF